MFDREVGPDTVTISDDYVRLDKRTKEAKDVMREVAQGRVKLAPKRPRREGAVTNPLDVRAYEELQKTVREAEMIKNTKADPEGAVDSDEELQRVIKNGRKHSSQVKPIPASAKATVPNLKLALDSLHGEYDEHKKESGSVKKENYTLKQKMARLEAALKEKRDENTALKQMLARVEKHYKVSETEGPLSNSFLLKSDPAFGRTVRSTQTRHSDFLCAASGSQIRDDEDDATKYWAPVEKRRRKDKRARAVAVRSKVTKTAESGGTIVLSSAVLGTTIEEHTPLMSMPGFRASALAKKSMAPLSSMEGTEIILEDGLQQHHIEGIPARVFEEAAAASQQGQRISIIKIGDQTGGYGIQGYEVHDEQQHTSSTMAQMGHDTVVILSAAEGEELPTAEELLQTIP